MKTPNLLKTLAICDSRTVTGELFYGADGWAVKAESSVLFGPASLTEIASLWETVVSKELPAASREMLENGGIKVCFVIEKATNDITFRPQLDVLTPHLYAFRLSHEDAHFVK